MRVQIKSYFVVIILILSALFVAMNFGYVATNTENDHVQTSDGLEGGRQPGSGYHWGTLDPISEPFLKDDWNIFDSSNTRIAVEGGKAYVVWEDETPYQGSGGDDDIFFRYFDGNQWSEIQVISEPVFGEDENDAGSYNPDIAVENGNIYVVWHDMNDTYGTAGDRDIFFKCNLTGSNWEAVQVISEPSLSGNAVNTGQSFNPSIDVENGNIYVAWDDNTDYDNSGVDWDVFYRCNRSAPGWEDIQVISEPVPGDLLNDGASEFVDLAVENGKIYVVWEDSNDTYGANIDDDIFFKCNLSGSYWETVQVISEPQPITDQNDLDSHDPVIAVENGNIYVAWDDTSDINGASGTGSNDDIFYICNLTQINWGNIQVISEPVQGQDFNTGTSSDPAITVENDIIHVVWEDNNQTDGSGTDSDIIYIYNASAGPGWGWSEMKAVSEPTFGDDKNQDTTEDPSIVVENGKLHLAYEDAYDIKNVGTDDDIFYRATFLRPEFSSPSVTPTTGNSSTVFNFTVTYTDVDNEAPTEIQLIISGVDYPVLEGNPSDNTYWNGKQYYYATILDIGDDHTYSFEASDGTYQVSTLIVNLPDVNNTAPKITTTDVETAFEDALYEVSYEYDDMDVQNVGQVVTWKLITDAGWLDINTTTGVLSGTPTNDDIDLFSVYVSINDTIDIDSTEFEITVQNVNDPPVITTVDIDTATSGEEYSVEYEADDIDPTDDTLTWSLLTDAGSWLALDGGNWLNGTPAYSDVGESWVNISVNDGNGGSDFHNFTLEVEPGAFPNEDPIIWPSGLPVAYLTLTYFVDYNATDDRTDPENLTWSWSSNATWLTFNTYSGLLKGAPTESEIGEYWVNITVNDDEGGSDYINYTITVGPLPNQKPKINTTHVTTAEIDVEYYVDYDATDDNTDADNLTWSLETNAGWLSLNITTGVLSGTPTEDDVGMFWVNITAHDDEDGVTLNTFTINVPEPSNRAPTLNITTEGGKKYKIGDQIVIEGESSDPDGDEVIIMVNIEFPDRNETGMQYITDEDDIASLPDEAKDLVTSWIKINTDGTWTYTFDTQIYNTIAKYLGDPMPTGTYKFTFMAKDSYFGYKESGNKTVTVTLEKGKDDGDDDGILGMGKLGGIDVFLILLIIIIIIIVIIIVVAILVRRRKAPARVPPPRPYEDEELEEGEYDEEEEDWEREGEYDEEEGEWAAGEEEEYGYEEAEEPEEAWDEEGEYEEEGAEEEWDVEEEEEAEEEEWEAEEDEYEEEELPELEIYDCPRCGEEIEIPYSDDNKVALKCEACGAKGMLPNPYLED